MDQLSCAQPGVSQAIKFTKRIACKSDSWWGMKNLISLPSQAVKQVTDQIWDLKLWSHLTQSWRLTRCRQLSLRGEKKKRGRRERRQSVSLWSTPLGDVGSEIRLCLRWSRKCSPTPFYFHSCDLLWVSLSVSSWSCLAWNVHQSTNSSTSQEEP